MNILARLRRDGCLSVQGIDEVVDRCITSNWNIYRGYPFSHNSLGIVVVDVGEGNRVRDNKAFRTSMRSSIVASHRVAMSAEDIH